MAKDLYRHFDGMTWPAVSQSMADLEWALRYNEPAKLPQSMLLTAASVLAAYRELVALPEQKRNRVIRELRKPAAVTPPPPDAAHGPMTDSTTPLNRRLFNAAQSDARAALQAEKGKA